MNRPAIDFLNPATHELRRALLQLHYALVEHERREFEKANGRVSPAGFLQVLTRDPAYGWLAPLSTLIIEFDTAIEERDGAPELAVLVTRSRALLRREPVADASFAEAYLPILDTSPDVALPHMQAIAALRHL